MSDLPTPRRLAKKWKHLIATDSSVYHEKGGEYVTVDPEKTLIEATIKALEETEEHDRAWHLLGVLDRLRKYYPESKEWTQEAWEATRYIATGRKAYWITESLADDKNERTRR